MCDFECPKCNHPHNASGNHEDDSGENECDKCGFKFLVEVEYDPTYSVSCVVHNWAYELVGTNTFGNRCSYCSTIDGKSLVDAVKVAEAADE